MNALERYRTERGLTFEALAALSQVDKGNVNKHCRGLKPIRGESSLRYHVALGIPLNELRPDLYGGHPLPPALASSSHPDEAA